MEGKLVIRSGKEGATVKKADCFDIEFTTTKKLRDLSPFLQNGHQITGTFCEECAPGAPIGSEGKTGQLIVGKELVLTVVLSDLLSITDPRPRRRMYKWSFMVLEVVKDSLGLVPDWSVTVKDEDDLIAATLPEKAWSFPREIALQLLWMPPDKLEAAIDYLSTLDLEEDEDWL